VCEAIASDNDGNQARDLGHGAGEERLQRGESGVEGAALGVSRQWNDQKKSEN